MKTAGLTRSELDRRLAAAKANGSAHQFEIPQERSGTAREAPSTGMRDGTATEAVQPLPETSVGAQPAAPPPDAGPDYPPIDTWVATDRGIERWRPLVDGLSINRLPGNERRLEWGAGRNGITLKLNAELALHLGLLLLPPRLDDLVRDYLAGRIRVVTLDLAETGSAQ